MTTENATAKITFADAILFDGGPDCAMSNLDRSCYSAIDQTNAQIERDGGHQFGGLYQGTRRVAAKTVEGNYGYQWLLHSSETELIKARGGRYLPVENPFGKGSRVFKSLGLTSRMELAPARAKLCAGTMYRGQSSSIVVRTGDAWGRDAKFLEDVSYFA